jgi:hypothetical protein
MKVSSGFGLIFSVYRILFSGFGLFFSGFRLIFSGFRKFSSEKIKIPENWKPLFPQKHPFYTEKRV